MFTVSSLRQSYNQRTCPSADKWLKVTGIIYTMELYSALKNNAMTFAEKLIDSDHDGK